MIEKLDLYNPDGHEQIIQDKINELIEAYNNGINKPIEKHIPKFYFDEEDSAENIIDKLLEDNE